MKFYLFFLLNAFSLLICNAQGYNFDQGVKSFNDKDFDKAIGYFDIDLNDNPKHASSYHYRAIIYYVKGNYSHALSDINTAIKYLSPKDKGVLAGAHQLRGDIHLKIDKYDEALEDYKTAIKLSPQDPDLYINRAQIYFELNQYDKAEADYRQVLKNNEGEVRAWAGLGRNYLDQKKYAEAEKTLNQLIKLSSDYSTGYLYRGTLYYEIKRYDEAIDDIFNSFLLDQNDTRISSLFISYAEKNYPLALSKVSAQISIYPEKEIWYLIRAQLYLGKSNYRAAIKDFTKTIELSDINLKPSLLIYRANCYSESGIYDQAITDYSDAISIDSTNSYMFFSRADTKRLMGNYNEAIVDFTKAIELEPRDPYPYYKRGWTKEFVNDFDGALDDYNQAISINKKYAYTYLNRGRLYESKLNNSTKAKEDYLAILSLDTIIQNSGNCRQYALHFLGRDAESIIWLNKIIDQSPSQGNYYDAACLYTLMKKPKEALSNLKLAFQNGYRDFIHLSVDEDLNDIRNSIEFKNLITDWEKIHKGEILTDERDKPKELNNAPVTVSIPMKSKGYGTYEIPCKINDLGLNLIFDTGASDISISQTEAQFMIKNGYLSIDDISGTQSYMDANGDISIGTTLILRKVDFGGLILKNVKASVVQNKNAPLLFGQSALSKYGKITIDNENKIITITTK